MAESAKQDDAPLGHHKGHKILAQKISVTTGDAINRTMAVAPLPNIKIGEMRDGRFRLVQTKESFENVWSEDDPDKLLGVTQVLHFKCMGAVILPVEDEGELSKMIQIVADAEDRRRAEKAGQSRFPVAAEDAKPKVVQLHKDEAKPPTPKRTTKAKDVEPEPPRGDEPK